MLMDRAHDANDFVVDVRHIVHVDDRPNSGHIYDPVNARHVFGFPHVVMAPNVLLHDLIVVVVGRRDRPATTVVVVPVMGACIGRGADQNPPPDQGAE
jgi:hypothetical protein